MTTLDIEVLGAEPEEYAATPTLTFQLGVTESSGAVVHAIALRCQFRIEPQRRHYNDREHAALRDLFGPPEQWKTSLKPFLWTHETTLVQGFEGETRVDLPMECTYDFEVLGSKYLHGLEEGTVPLILLFNGTIFTRGTTGFTVEQMSWDVDARYDLPVEVWEALMDQHYGGTGWLRAHRDTIGALQRFKGARGLTTWDETLETLLRAVDEEVLT